MHHVFPTSDHQTTIKSIVVEYVFVMKNRRCGSRGKLWLEKVLSRKSYGGVFLGDGA